MIIDYFNYKLHFRHIPRQSCFIPEISEFFFLRDFTLDFRLKRQGKSKENNFVFEKFLP